MSYFPSSHLAPPSMTHSLWLFPNLPPGGFFPLFTDDTTFYTAFSLTFPRSAAGRRFFPLLTDGSTVYITSSLTFTDGTTVYITSSLTFFLLCTLRGEISLLTVLPAGIFSLLKVGNTDTTEGNFAHQCCLRRDFFPYTRVATLNFQTWRRRGGGHVTWEVEGVILFLRNRLPPLGHASHITTHVYNLVSCCMGGCPSTT